MKIKCIVLLLIITLNLNAQVATKDSVAKLYVATFNRAPDTAGLNYWVTQSGLSLEGIAKSFFDQPETVEIYGKALQIDNFIIEVYNNLFDRQPDIDGANYWSDELSLGNVDSSTFILAVVNGAENSDKTILDNKTTVGLTFAYAGLSDLLDASTIMSGVDVNSQSVIDALNKFNLKSIDIQSVVNRTNQIRQERYSDTNVIWNDILASSAQEYANTLALNGDMKHSSNTLYSENLAAAPHYISYTQATDWWYKEKAYYDYDTNSCHIGKGCGHYAQLIWKDTIEMGCGSAIYQAGKYLGGTIIICHYNP